MKTEEEKIVSLIRTLILKSNIKVSPDCLTVNNSKYGVTIKANCLPDWSYKVEFSSQDDNSITDNFILPYTTMKRVMSYIATELTDEANDLALEESGYHKVGSKVREIIELLHSDIEVKENTAGAGFVAWDKCEMFENRIGIEQMRCSYKTDSYGSDRKSRNQEEIGNGFIKIIYTHLIPNPDRDSTKKYKTQNITVLIPAIEAENYEVLEKCMPQAIRSNCSSLIETLEKNYKNKNIKTLLLHNKLQDGFPEDGTPNNNKSIKKL